MRLVYAALVGTLLGAAACGPSHPAARSPNAQGGVPVAPVAVSDADFARSAYQVLVTGAASQQRTDLLAGVVRRQLLRAERRFERGHVDAGLAAVTGAFYLLRAGELHPVMLQGGGPALIAGAAEVARHGNEGKAAALYGMLQTILPTGHERQDVDNHLAALSKWSASRGAGPMQAAGSDQRAAVQRSLYDARAPMLATARDRTIGWIKRALESNVAEQPVRTSLERDEAIEAYRALRAGGATLVAVYLRHGDPKGALDAIERSDLARVVPPGLRDRVERIALENDPAAWNDLFRLFEMADTGDRPETSIDPELARAAAWGTALGLYRSEPSSSRGVAPCSALLLELGMAEVAPRIAAPAINGQSTIDEVSWAMGLVQNAILIEDEVGEIDAARRAYAAAAPIVEIAEKRFGGKVRPSPGRLHYVMGFREQQAGELARARPHLEAAARAEPSVDVFMNLSAIDRQRGDAKAALVSLEQVTTLARKAGDAASEGEALVMAFEIHRDQPNAELAKTALHAALKRALDARQLAKNPANQARAERLLARVLDYFGNAQGARRALERAYDASGGDLQQLTQTVLDASRRALTRNDLAAARDAMQRALDARLPGEDLVYVALWLQLLERKLGVATDGSAEEAYATIDDASGWASKLRSWARGKMTDDELFRSAQNRVEHTEANFYTAMARAVQGNREAALPKLREVAASETVKLIEVDIARDLLAQQASPPLDFRMPPNVDVP